MILLSLVCVTVAVLAAFLGFASESAGPMWVAGVLFVISAGFLLMSWPGFHRRENQPSAEDRVNARQP